MASLAFIAIDFDLKAARILVNLLVLGGGILARGMVQAYRQALQS
ncbi:hypothetical protein Tco_0219257, partial [Tanacetum coccineum]